MIDLDYSRGNRKMPLKRIISMASLDWEERTTNNQKAFLWLENKENGSILSCAEALGADVRRAGKKNRNLC